MLTVTGPRGQIMLALLMAMTPVGAALSLPANPILFVTQVPIADDIDPNTNFNTITNVASQFGNQFPLAAAAPRGGDLMLRAANGSLRNLTREAGFGSAAVFQGAGSIAVRDPHVHWSAGKAIFSMVIGSPAQANGAESYVWQLYELSNLAAVVQGAAPAITLVPNQPGSYNNFQPSYLSDGSIVFVSDRPLKGASQLYPQNDEYRQVKTNSGIWRLDPASGALTHLDHSPSGSFKPFVDSFGRLLFTRWDHLMQDNLSSPANIGLSGAFDYLSEAANASTSSPVEVFPEPIVTVPGSNVNGFEINLFQPWMMNQDGTDQETLNHVGRHELRTFVGHSFTDDDASNGGNLVDLNGVNAARTNTKFVGNFSQLVEDPTQAGRYLGVDGSEFVMHSSGQIVALTATPSTNPFLMTVEYLTDRATSSIASNANNIGHFRDPLPLSDGSLVAAYANFPGPESNGGTVAAPIPKYLFRLFALTPNGSGTYLPTTALTAGIARSVQFFNPQTQVSWSGNLWELQPVEVVARTAPPDTIEGGIAGTPEQAAFDAAGVSVAEVRSFLKSRNLALVVVRNSTVRDSADRQQPFNLKVAGAGGTQTLGAPGKIYDIAQMQFFEADHVRGLGGSATPLPGRRPIPRFLNDTEAQRFNPPQPGAPAGSQPIFADGSVAVFVPAQRAMTWQELSPLGTAVVRERYWVSFQPGEIRTCGGCHGVNASNQAGGPGAVNTPQALISLLSYWKASESLFVDGFEAP
jgi:hypothetical protein